MQISRKTLTVAFLCGLAVLALSALAGVPLISHEAWAALAAAGAMPMALTGEVGGDMRKMFDQLTETAKAAKETVEQVRKAHEDLDGRVNKIHEELKTGGPDAVTKAAYQDAVAKVDKVEKALDKVNLEVSELAKKATSMLGSQGQQKKSLGQLAAESDAAKNYKGGTVELCTMAGPLFAKANLTSGAASAGSLVVADRLPGVIMGPDTPPTVRDLFLSVSTSTNAIEWVRELLYTNNAGPQALGAEGGAKPESAITFEKKTTPVETIAHWIPISRQVLADVPQLQGLVDGRLRQGLKMKEDLQLLLGDGTNGNLLGLIPQATVFSATGMPAIGVGEPGYTRIDYLRWAFLQVAKAQYPATFAVLSLEDWALIQMMKTTDGAYIFGTPTDGASPRVWGKTVVESHNLALNNFVAGSAFAATVYDREDVSVRVAEQHADFFIKNMVAMLCEERLALTVERPQAIVAGAFPAA